MNQAQKLNNYKIGFFNKKAYFDKSTNPALNPAAKVPRAPKALPPRTLPRL